MIAIQTNNLTKKFDNIVAVDDLFLSVEEGSLFSLLGINGAGKTTTIKMLCCLLVPTSGDAFILGSNILKDSQQVKEKINISPQETAIAPNLTVEENLKFVAELYGLSKHDAHEKTQEMLKDFSLLDRAKDKAKKLSGGMQRRLSIAMALITKPKVLFLDEPTLGLDVIARRELWNIIKRLKGKITIILTTHYMEEAEALSDKIAIMSKGKIKASGTSDELMQLTNTKKLEDAFIVLAGEGVPL